MRRRQALLIVCGALAGTGLLEAAKSGYDYDPEFDFSKLKRYAWKTHPVMEENPALARVAIAGDIVMSDGNEILMKRGYIPDEFEPDFYISFFVKGTLESKEHRFNSSWYYGPGTAWTSYQTFTSNFIDGTLVIDIVDAKSGKLVWRAFYQDKVHDWKKRHKQISQGVKKAFEKFPPKKKR